MNEFDKSFISNFEINDLTEEEINNLRIQRNEIDTIADAAGEGGRNRRKSGKY